MADSKPDGLRSPADVLDFWFSEAARTRWFVKESEFDDEIRRRFGATAQAAAEGRLQAWAEAPESCLALVILLDQFPRNIHRGTPRAFATDAQAREAARSAVARGFDRRLPLERRWFLYLPFEHSEDPGDQREAVALFRLWAEEHPEGPAREGALEQLDYARRHETIIERFGRFPHRNAILGRDSTPAELDFLQEPNSSF